MALDVAAIQRALRTDRLDGWLLYDFHGSNPIASGLAGLMHGPHMTTRRWYYLIPAEGEPRGIVHAIERHNLDGLPGAKIEYAGTGAARSRAGDTARRSLSCRDGIFAGLRDSLSVARRCGYRREPFGGTGSTSCRRVTWFSKFEAAWSADQLASHQAASDALYRIKDRAFHAAAAAVRDRSPLTEYDLQRRMVGWFEAGGTRQRFGPGGRGRRQRGRSALPAHSGRLSTDRCRRSTAPGSCGASRQPPEPCLLTLPGWA